MKTLLKLVGILAWLGLALGAASCGKSTPPPFTPTGEFDVQVTLSTNVITVGDVIDATIDVYHPMAGLATVPEIDRRPEIVVRTRASTSEAYNETLALTRINYRLTSYRVGIHLLSTNQVICVTDEGETLSRKFPDVNLVVTSVRTNDTAEVMDLRPLAEPESPFSWMIAGILCVIVLAIVLAIVIALLVKKPTVVKQPPPPPPAHETALSSLNLLRASGMIESRDFAPFYVAVSDILRTYIENRFKLHAPEMTTEEFMDAAARSQELNSEHHLLVKSFLEECDMVKFAKLEPDEGAMLRVWEAAERFVKETIPGQNPFGNHPPGGNP